LLLNMVIIKIGKIKTAMYQFREIIFVALERMLGVLN
jgi:hypothetical protein